MKKGLISVVLPVYNGEKFLAESIDSVLNQTYKEFELIIVIDGSKDQSLEIARSYNDPRIRIHLNPINLGLVGALNVGLEQCTGEFIARMDQDDISVTSRFEKQINYLNLNPNVGVLGTAYRIFGREEKDMILPQSNDQIKLLSFFKNPFCHPSVMFRRSVLEKYS
ncbi:MAG: glycosyltransferase, partial [Crocinitomicaceae bacterium]|nr:glycosyltransferase [Crocinitomicaceae bacterium]